MLFNSFEFIFIFLPLVIIIYFWLSKNGNDAYPKIFLVLVSLFFYGYFKAEYVIIIVASILVNYIIGHHMEKTEKGTRKLIFMIGMIFNIGLIGYFKYYDFFIANVNSVLKSEFPILGFILPLGISFFTFQQISYIVDCYRKKTVKYDFLSYCLFVTFFPQLIAGPIVLPSEMLPQFENHENKKINYENMSKGFYLFSIGLAKKVLLADNIGILAESGFDQMTTLTFIEGWISSFAYTFQLYFDFSGYCDMAIGIGLMFNILLPLNFNSPYKSGNIQEFWKRWHITLGRFLTNYLYIPLGGNRVAEWKIYRNLIIVFLVSGIWHGAGWNFIIWGALHGISILIHRFWKSRNLVMNKFIGIVLTFFIVNLFWIFFRSDSLEKAGKVLTSLIDFRSYPLGITREYIAATADFYNINSLLSIFFAGVVLVFLFPNSYERTQKFEKNRFALIEQSIYLLLGIISLNKIATFLYFNF